MLSESKLTPLFGILVFLILATYGWNHRVAGGLILLLVLTSLVVLFTQPRPMHSQDSDRLVKLSIVSFISLALGVVISLAIHQQWEMAGRELDNPARFLLVIPIFLAMLRMDLNPKYLVWGLAAGAVLTGLMAYSQYNGTNVSLSHNHHIPFGNVATSIAILSALALWQLGDKGKVQLFLAVTAFGFGFLASVLSGARGGWISVVTFFFVILLIYRSPVRSKVLIVLISCVGLFLLNSLSGGYIVTRVLAGYQDVACFIASEGDACGSLGARLWMWQVAVTHFLEHPVIGSGLNTAEALLREATRAGVIPVGISYGHFHNDFIEMASAQGLVGIMSYLGLYLIPIYIAYSLSKSVSAAPWSVLITLNAVLFMEYGLSQASLTHASSGTFLAFLMAVLMGYGLSSSMDRAR